MRAILTVVLLSTVAMPAAAQNREHVQMAAELRMIQEQTHQLALTLAQLGEVLTALNARIDDVNDNTRKSFADQKLVIDEVGNDLRVIRERTQENNTRVGTLREEIEALRVALQAAPRRMDPTDPTDPTGSADPTDPSATAPFQPSFQGAPQAPTAGVSPDRMYQTAWADYTSGQFTLAITGFEQFVRTFPQSERADDAQLLIGESYYATNRFPEAISVYNQVIQNYASGDQVATAYYKRGLAQSQVGQTDAARSSWEIVLRLFPDSYEADLAKQNLDRLGSQTTR